MVTPAVANIKRIPGRVVLDPSDLTADFPYGGTAIGNVRDCIYRENGKIREIEAEEFGVLIDAIRGKKRPIFLAVMRTLDDDGLSAIFTQSETGTSGHVLIKIEPKTETGRPGTLLSDAAVALLFAPKAEDVDDWVYLPRALPLVTEAAELQLSFAEELGIAVAFLAIPDASDRVAYVGRRTDITL